MPEKDNQLSFEAIKLSAVNTLKKGAAIAGSVIAMTGAILEHEATFPDKVQAEMVCTTSPGGDSTVCTTEPDNPPTGGNEHQPTDDGGSKDQPKPHAPIHQPKEDNTNSQRGFKGYNMGATRFTDHNGCFITSGASALRRVTGDPTITPRSIYFPALRSKWTPSGGVEPGAYLFDALPSIARHFGVKVYKIDNAAGALKAVKRGDQVQMLAAPPSHFTYGGHYLDARATTPNGKKLILDDPNGKGLHGDSERPSGWSPSQLANAGVIAYRGLHLIER